jgi:hypothetical protein
MTHEYDGHRIVVSYDEAEVSPLDSGGILVTLPVTLYGPDGGWRAGGSIHLGAEPQQVVVAEVEHWARCLTVVPDA